MTVVGTVEYLLEMNSEQFKTSLRAADFALRGFERSLGRSNPLLREFGTLVTITGLSVMVDKLFEAGDAMTQMERRNATLTNTINASNDAMIGQNDIMSFLYETAKATGVQIETLDKALGRMLPAAAANNIAFGDLKQTLIGTVGALTLSGASAEEQQRAFVAIGQVVGKNRLQMEELRGQLGEALPTAMLILADGLTKVNKSLGKTGDEAIVTISKLNKMVSEGKIDAAQFIEAWKRGTESYAKIADANITLVSGQYNKLATILEVQLGSLMRDSGIQQLFAATLATINENLENYLKSMNGSAEQFGDTFKKYFTDAIIGAGNVVDEWGPTVAGAKDIIMQLLREVKSGWDALPQEIKEWGIILALLGGPKVRAGITVALAGVGVVKDVFKDIAETGGERTAEIAQRWEKTLVDGAINMGGNVVSAFGKVADNIAETMLQKEVAHDQQLVDQAKARVDQIAKQLEQAQGASTASALLEAKAQSEQVSKQLDELDAQREQRLKNLQESSDKFVRPETLANDPALQALNDKIEQLKERKTALDASIRALVVTNNDTLKTSDGVDLNKLLQDQADATEKLKKLTDELTDSKNRLADAQAEVNKNANDKTAGNDKIHENVRLNDLIDGITTGREVATKINDSINSNIAQFKQKSEEALKATVEIQKSEGLSFNLSGSATKNLDNMITSLQTIGSATGEAQKELTTFRNAIYDIDQAIQSLNASTKQIGDDTFAARFGMTPDAAKIALATRAATRIASIDNVAATKTQLDADVKARKASLNALRDQLKEQGIDWKDYNKQVADLNASAANAYETLQDKLLAKDVKRLNKRIEATDAMYQAQEGALAAYIEAQNRPLAFEAKLAEERRKGLKGALSTAAQGLEAVTKADTEAQIRAVQAEQIKFEVARAQENDKNLVAKRQFLFLENAMLEVLKQRHQLEFDQSAEGNAVKITQEKLAAETRLAAAQFESRLLQEGWYSQSQLTLALQVADNRLLAAKAEAALAADPALREKNNAADVAEAQNALENERRAIELRQQGTMQAIELQRAVNQATNGEIDAQNRLNALRNDEIVTLQRKTDMLNALVTLQEFVNEATKPLGEQIFESLSNGLDGGIESLSSGLTDVITGVQSLDDLWKNTLKNMISGMIEFFLQWGLKWAAAEALQLAGITTVTTAQVAATATQTAAAAAGQTAQAAVSTAAAAEVGAAWAAPAAAVSVASYGSAVAIGGAALIALLGIVGAMFAMGKFHDGGVAQNEQIAKLMKGELVVPQSHSRAAYEMLTAAGVPFGQVGSKGAMGGSGKVSYGNVASDYVTDGMVGTLSHGSKPTIINVFDMAQVDQHLRRNPGSVINVVERDKRNRGLTLRNAAS